MPFLLLLLLAAPDSQAATWQELSADCEADAPVSMLQTRAYERQKRWRSTGAPSPAASERAPADAAVAAGKAPAPENATADMLPLRASHGNGTALLQSRDAENVSSAGGQVRRLLAETWLSTRQRPHALLQVATKHASQTSLVLVILLAALTAGVVYFIMHQDKKEVSERAFQDQLAAPLCKSLVAHKDEALLCEVPCNLWRERQHVSFTVKDPAGAGVAYVSASEVLSRRTLLQLWPPGGSGSPLACASTEAIYTEGDQAPRIPIFQGNAPPEPLSAPTAALPLPEAVLDGLSRASAAKQRQQQLLQAEQLQSAVGAFAVLQRGGRGEYVLSRLGKDILSFAAGPEGFKGHDIEVFVRKYHKVAKVEPIEPERRGEEGGKAEHSRYKVSIFPGVDGGLVLLCLLAIDKCERQPPPPVLPKAERRCYETIVGPFGTVPTGPVQTVATGDLM